MKTVITIPLKPGWGRLLGKVLKPILGGFMPGHLKRFNISPAGDEPP